MFKDYKDLKNENIDNYDTIIGIDPSGNGKTGIVVFNINKYIFYAWTVSFDEFNFQKIDKFLTKKTMFIIEDYINYPNKTYLNQKNTTSELIGALGNYYAKYPIYSVRASNIKHVPILNTIYQENGFSKFIKTKHEKDALFHIILTLAKLKLNH